jgi:hypothetical protein
LTKFVWALVAVVLLVALARIVIVTHKHRSTDQKILIEKSKQ